MEQLRDIIERFVAVRDERRALERQAEELRRGEESELKNRIIMKMHEQGMKTINFDSLGRVTSKARVAYAVYDHEKLAKFLLRSLLLAHKEGRALADGLFLQSRVRADVLNAMIEAGEIADINDAGISTIETPEISVTKR